MDNEIKGESNSYTTPFRQYDPRVGRWLSLDPLAATFPYQSAYAAFNNSPIYFKDPTGLMGDPPGNTNAIQNIDRKLINSLVDMAGSSSVETNSIGWPRDAKFFWNKFKDSDLGKDALSKDNLTRISDGLSPQVDDQWNDIMKKYDLDGNMGEGIEHHHHNKGRTAYPRPKSKHTGKAWNKILHNLEKREGKVSQKAGKYRKMQNKKGLMAKVGKIGRALGVFAEVAEFYMIIDGHPNSAMNDPNIITVWEMGKAYNNGFGGYMEVVSYNNSTFTLQHFEAVEKIDGEYRGVLKVGTAQTQKYGEVITPPTYEILQRVKGNN